VLAVVYIKWFFTIYTTDKFNSLHKEIQYIDFSYSIYIKNPLKFRIKISENIFEQYIQSKEYNYH